MRWWVKVGCAVAFAAAFMVADSVPLSADHAWRNYHWARTTDSFTLTVVNSTTHDWDGYVSAAVADWSLSTVLNLVEDPNGSTDTKVRRQCSAPSGAVRICNLAYGYNGWLGVAGISVDVQGHIVRGYTKLNDSYFNLAYYNTPLWKQSVTCQELGHNIGLGHQDEDFNNTPLYSCMDYQDPPYGQPNVHDFEQLAAIYDHRDSYDSYAGATSGGDEGGSEGDGCNAPPGRGCNRLGQPQAGPDPDAGWGISLGRHGRRETFMRIDPDGTRHITSVTWAERR